MTNNNSLYANNAATMLTGTIANTDVNIPVSSTVAFPTISSASDWFYITLDDGVYIEIVKVTSVVGNVFTGCVRGQDGTTARAFGGTPTKVENRLTAGNIRRLARLTDRLQDVVSIENIPSPSTADGNSVLCASGDASGVPILAVVSGSKWKFINYPVLSGNGAVAAGFSGTSIPVAGANATYPVSGAKAYVIQFTSGANIGACRYATMGGATISWVTALPSALAIGDTYDVYTDGFLYSNYQFVHKSGDTMTGALTLPGNAVSNLQAVPLQQVTTLVGTSMPPGMINMFGGSIPPAGWLECDGSEVSRVTYANLFAAILTIHGAGDGSTTFKLPDMRGEFPRGWDHGRGIDSGRAVGSSQESQVQAHKHVSVGESSMRPDPFGKTIGHAYWGIEGTDDDNYMWHTNDGSDFDGVVNPAGLIGPENRPRNIALMYCIKT